MQAKNSSVKRPVSSTTHRRVQSSTTLNRKYVRRPRPNINAVRSKTTTSVKHVAQPVARPAAQPATAKKPRPVRKPTPKAVKKPAPTPKPTAKPAAKTTPKSASPAKTAATKTASTAKPATAKPRKGKKRARSIIIALVCAACCIAALAVFLKLNIPTISVSLAASQTGINASYPSYVPHDYTLSSVTSENDQVIMTFKGPEGKTFRLTEQKSSWDSNALLNNFVKEEWGDNYSTAREQGLTIYVSGSNATWVNGGILYHIYDDTNTLTKKQIYSLATSL